MENVVRDYRFYVRLFNYIKDNIPDTLSYSATIHHELKKNIKSDLIDMQRIETSFPAKMNKLVYISIKGRLDRIFKEIIIQSDIEVDEIVSIGLNCQ